MTPEEIAIRQFLTFAELKGVEMGGTVTYGFAMEYSDFRPMHKDDYGNLISDFVKSLKAGNEQPKEIQPNE